MVMTEITADQKADLIEALTTDVEELSLTVRTARLLKDAGIKYVAHLLTYDASSLRKDVFPSHPKSQDELYDALNELHVKKWFNALVVNPDVRGMDVAEELEAYLNEQPDDLFETILSEDMFEEGSLEIARRAERLAKIKTALPERLKKGLSNAFRDEVALELLEADVAIENVPSAARTIVVRKLDLTSAAHAAPQTLGKG